jgi:hypothetical protein
LYKQEDALSPLLFNFALEYAMKNVQKNHLRLKLNEIYQLLAYSENMNLLGDNLNTMKIAKKLLNLLRKLV